MCSSRNLLNILALLILLAVNVLFVQHIANYAKSNHFNCELGQKLANADMLCKQSASFDWSTQTEQALLLNCPEGNVAGSNNSHISVVYAQVDVWQDSLSFQCYFLSGGVGYDHLQVQLLFKEAMRFRYILNVYYVSNAN